MTLVIAFLSLSSKWQIPKDSIKILKQFPEPYSLFWKNFHNHTLFTSTQFILSGTQGFAWWSCSQGERDTENTGCPKEESPYEYNIQCCCCSIAQLCPTLCDPMDCCMLAWPSLPLICSNSCSLSQWCHQTISCYVAPSSSCPQPFPASESFPMNWRFASGGQSIGASVSASVFSTNIQGWFSLVSTGLSTLLSKGLSRVFSSNSSKASVLWHSAFFMVQLSHLYMVSCNQRTFYMFWALHSTNSTFLCLFLLEYTHSLISQKGKSNKHTTVTMTELLFTLLVPHNVELQAAQFQMSPLNTTSILQILATDPFSFLPLKQFYI